MTEAHHAELPSCALYVAGLLDPPADRAFERHLGTCLICLDECERLSPLVAALAAIEPGSVDAPAETRPLETPRARTAAPVRPPHRPTGRRRRRLALAAAALGVVGALTVGVALDLGRTGPAPESVTLRPVDAEVTAQGRGTSATLSISVGSRPDSPTPVCVVRATITGLTADVGYQLLAVTADATTYQVKEWTATGGAQDVTGEVAVALESLAFFAVASADGTSIVSARIVRPTPTG